MHFVVLVHKLRMLVDKKNHDAFIFFLVDVPLLFTYVYFQILKKAVQIPYLRQQL